MNDTTRLDRAKGALYGAAVGDALGLTYEFLAPGDIPPPPYNMVGGGPFNFPQGAGSDDTALLLAAMRSYTGTNAFDEKFMVAEMVKWLDSNPPDVGSQTRFALTHYKAGQRMKEDDDAQGNGGLMRAAAHGIMCDNWEAAYENAALDTMLTHPSNKAASISGDYAEVLFELVDGRLTGEVIRNTVLEAYDRPVADPGGHCLHSYRLALWALTQRDEGFENVMNMVIRTGGDTDTNATIAGALVGAALGFDAIPGRWVDALRIEGLAEQAARLE